MSEITLFRVPTNDARPFQQDATTAPPFAVYHRAARATSANDSKEPVLATVDVTVALSRHNASPRFQCLAREGREVKNLTPTGSTAV